MSIAKIDRSLGFDPVAFMWPKWRIAKLGENFKSSKITRLNLASIVLTSRQGNEYKVGDELAEIRKDERIPLDAVILEWFWKNKTMIPEWWKRPYRDKPLMIFFMGTVVVYENGVEAVLCLYWNHNRWHWSYRALRDEWTQNCVVAVLAT